MRILMSRPLVLRVFIYSFWWSLYLSLLHAGVHVSMTTNPSIAVINERVHAFIYGNKTHGYDTRNHVHEHAHQFSQIVTIQIHVDVHEGDYIYADYIALSSDSPYVILSQWQTTIDPISRYDIAFKRTKKIFTQPFTITATAEIISIDNRLPHTSHVHITYYAKSSNGISHDKLSIISIPKQATRTRIKPNVLSTNFGLPNHKQGISLSRATPRIVRIPAAISTEHKPLFSWTRTIHSLYVWCMLLICILVSMAHTQWQGSKNIHKTQDTSLLTYLRTLWCILAIVCACIIYIFTVAF